MVGLTGNEHRGAADCAADGYDGERGHRNSEGSTINVVVSVVLFPRVFKEG